MLEKLIAPVTQLAGKFIADKDQKSRFEHELKTLTEKQDFQLLLENAKTNTEQAKHASLFVAGARPAIMWICALGLAWSFILAPIFNYFAIIFDLAQEVPKIDKEGILTLTLSLLGLGGMRSFEKYKGKARDSL